MRFFKFILLSLFLVSNLSFAKISTAGTTPDMTALLQSVGGDEVESFSIAKGTQDPHFIEAKPSFMVKLREVQLVVAHGLELETAWLIPLIRGARNPEINPGTKGYLELGSRLDPIEVLGSQASRGQGDVHPAGNPHFQLDPYRMGKAALLVADRLSELDPAHKQDFHQRAENYKKNLESKAEAWKKRLKSTGIAEVVSYHKTFSYFMNAFGVKNTLHLEPKPGIPPTASHLLDVIHQMKARQIRLVLIENFFDDSAKDKLTQEVPGIKVVRVPVYVGGEPEVLSTEKLIETLVQAFEGAAS